MDTYTIIRKLPGKGHPAFTLGATVKVIQEMPETETVLAKRDGYTKVIPAYCIRNA